MNCVPVLIARGFGRRKELPEDCKFYLAEAGASDKFGHNARWKRRALKSYESTRLTAGFGEPGKVGLHFTIGTEGRQCSFKNSESAGIRWTLNTVVHPLPFATRRDDTGTAQVGQVARDLRLALTQNLDEIADAHFPAVHKVEQAQSGAVCQCGEERGKVEIGRVPRHEIIIYALTDIRSRNIFV